MAGPARAPSRARSWWARNTCRRSAGSLRRRALGCWALDLLCLQLGDEIPVARALDHRVELRAVIGDQADALDGDVIDEPAGTALHHAVVHRDLGPLLGHDPRPDDRLLAVDGLAEVADRLAGVHLDLRDVRVLEEIAVQGNELLAFGRGPGSPVRSEAACQDLGEIEELAEIGRHTSELQSPCNLVCRLLLEKKKKK